MKKLTSLQNPLIKSLVLLKEKGKARSKYGSFIIEGRKEIALAIKGNYKVETVLFYSKICSYTEAKKISEDSEFIEITKEIYEKLSYRDTTEGIIGISKIKDLKLSKLKLSKNPLILIADSIEKPGNIGALLRTADAANLDAVIISNPICNLYNSNTIRSSIGCLFTNQLAIGESSDIIRFLKDHSINIFCATLQSANQYYNQNYTHPTAFIIGNESVGVSKEWRDAADENIIIPMQGEIDSMNVSVSAAILMFEAKRQRGF